VPDEVISRLEQLGDEWRVRLEVDACDRRIRREAGAIDDEQLEAVRERALRRPRPTAPDDAPVDEDEALHEAILAVSLT
jgi:hypothetical protein